MMSAEISREMALELFNIYEKVNDLKKQISMINNIN